MEFLVLKRRLQGDSLCQYLPYTDQMQILLKSLVSTKTDLSGTNLIGANLSDADFSGEILSSLDGAAKTI